MEDMNGVIKSTLDAVGLVIFLTFIITQILYVLASVIKIRKGRMTLKNRLPKKEDRISILVPAYNEEKVLEKCIQGILDVDYKNYEVIFINDGSTDHSLKVLNNALDLKPAVRRPRGELNYTPAKTVYRSLKHKNIFVIDKENGGKSDSLNAGIDYSLGQIIVTLDADSVLKADSLYYINQTLRNQSIVAAGGAVLAGQMYKRDKVSYSNSFLMKYQLSNYISAFYCRKVAQSSLNALTVVSGAFGAFRSSILREVQGYKKTLGEDMEITMSIQKLIYTKYPDKKMVYVPEAVCYTEVPENVKDLLKQRIRWQKGFLDCLMKYRKELFDSFSFKFLFILLWDSCALGLSGCVAILSLPIILLFTHQNLIFMFVMISSLIVQYVVTMIAYLYSATLGYKMNKTSYIRLIVYTFFEIFTYRLLDTFVFIYGTINYFLVGDKYSWNKIERSGSLEY